MKITFNRVAKLFYVMRGDTVLAQYRQYTAAWYRMKYELTKS